MVNKEYILYSMALFPLTFTVFLMIVVLVRDSLLIYLKNLKKLEKSYVGKRIKYLEKKKIIKETAKLCYLCDNERNLIKLKCNHELCEVCNLKWRIIENACPYCRSRFDNFM